MRKPHAVAHASAYHRTANPMANIYADPIANAYADPAALALAH
jgi:hypothetical protein